MLNNLNHLGLPTCSFDLCLGCFGESADLNGNLLFELAVGKNLYTVAGGLYDAGLNERRLIDDCAVFKSVEGVEIETISFAKILLKPLFGILLCSGI